VLLLRVTRDVKSKYSKEKWKRIVIKSDHSKRKYEIMFVEVTTMTVQELKEKLDEFPDDATVMLLHQLVGSEHYAESAFYEKNDYHDQEYGVVWICEVRD
jgi:hypothetical protein